MLEKWFKFLTTVLAGSEIKIESKLLKLSAKGLAALLALFLALRVGDFSIQSVVALVSPPVSAAATGDLIPPRTSAKVASQDR